MKKLLAQICVALYRVNSDLLRKILRSCISRLDGGQAFSISLRVVMKKYHGYDIGIGTYGACFNPSQAFCGFGNLKVGKFTSIAPGVCMYTRNHPYWNPSTSPLFYNSKFINRGGYYV